MTDVVEAYAQRIEAMNQDQIRTTLAQHDRLVDSERWLKLDGALRDQLLQMGELLRAALK